MSVAVLPGSVVFCHDFLQFDLQLTFNFTESEEALSENGMKSVSELSEPESSHCEDEVQPGTPPCTPHFTKLKTKDC